MNLAFSPDHLRDAAQLAKDCPVMEQAATLARWIGPLSIDQVTELKVSLAALAEQGSPS